MHPWNLDAAFSATAGVFTLAMLTSRGVSRRKAARWRAEGLIVRVCGRGFVRRGRVLTLERRAIAACLTWPDAIVCFRTAARLHGLPAPDVDDIDVLVPSTRQPVNGIRPHFWSVHPTGVVRRGSLVVTDRVTTIADCLGRLPSEEAWGMLALLYTRDQLTAADLDEQLQDRRRMHGVVRLRSMAGALALSAVSLPEVQLQQLLSDGGISGGVGNLRIWDAGRVVARADVGFLAGRLVLEYDGGVAHGPGRRSADARRTERLQQIGFEVLRIRWIALHDRRRLLLATVRTLLVESDPVRRRAIADAWNEYRYLDLATLVDPRRGLSDVD